MTKTILTVACLVIFTQIAIAQKSGAQQQTYRAPGNVKIDGKVGEWNTSGFTIKSKTQLSYTIANDDKNVYLAVIATDSTMAKKIISGGINFAIVPVDNTKNNHKISVTFPSRAKDDPPFYFKFEGYPLENNDTVKRSKALDSFVVTNNKLLSSKLKLIRLQKLNKTASIDSLLSIYNAEGIAAAASFDKAGQLNWELSIPTTLIKGELTTSNTFQYNIMLKGQSIPGTIVKEGPGGRGFLIAETNDGKMYMLGRSTPENFNLFTETEISGDFTLAK